MTETTLDPERYVFLDWLRIGAILVLLFFHTGMLFVGWHFHIQNAETIDALALPMDLSHRLRMPLLFVIAGAGLWFAFRRRTASGVMKERTLRLLVPVIFGMLVVVPPQIYVERLFRDQWDGGYIEFYLQRVLEFRPYPEGDFSWHHLWFIVYLFLYVPLLLPLLAWLRRQSGKIAPGPWVYAFALLLGANEALLKPHYPQTHALIGDWYVFSHYLWLTAFGVLLASVPGMWDWLAKRRNAALLSAVLVTGSAIGLLDTGIVQRDTAGDAFLANAFTWFWLLAFLALGRRFLSVDNAWLRWARDASYPVYILHQTVMLAVAYWVIAQPWGPWAKFWTVLVATVVLSSAIYEVLVRRFAFTRLMFGMKGRASKADLPVHSSTAKLAS